MPIEDWTRNSDGSVVVSHLLAWEAIIAPAAGALRMQTVATPAEAEAGQTSELQIVLDIKQLRDLGQAFLNMADKLEQAQAQN